MDLNQSMEFTSSSTPPPAQVHNFMPMAPFMPQARYHQTTHGDGLDGMRSHLKQSERQILQLFWTQRMFEICNISGFKSQHQLPLARIKKIMKADEDVKMISADTPVLFSKACEIFIMELTLRAWLRTEESRRRTLQRCDIARAVKHDEVLDFLVDVIPSDHPKEFILGDQENSPQCMTQTSISSAGVKSESTSE